MIKKLLLIVLFYNVCQLSFGETCPNVADIKHQLPKGWALYDSDEGKPLSAERIAHFMSTVEQFALAEWMSDKNKGGVIHCYYRDQNGSDLEAYLAKENYIPFDPKNFWYQVSGYRHCAAGQDKCLFQSNSLHTKQLAKTRALPKDKLS